MTSRGVRDPMKRQIAQAVHAALAGTQLGSYAHRVKAVRQDDQTVLLLVTRPGLPERRFTIKVSAMQSWNETGGDDSG